MKQGVDVGIACHHTPSFEYFFKKNGNSSKLRQKTKDVSSSIERKIGSGK